MSFYKILLLACFTLLAFRGNAQFQNGVFENSFKHLNTRNGLSNDFVNQVVKDQSGFLWIATQNGLNRYDGVHIKTYYHNPADSNSICSNYISALLADAKGRVWIGTADARISVYDGKTQKIRSYFPSDSLANHIRSAEFITSFYEDSQHRIWVSTWGSGLYLFNEVSNGFEQYSKIPNQANSLYCNKVKSIVEDKNGRFWVGLWADGPTDTSGIQIFDPGRNSFYNYYSYLKNSFGGEIPKPLRSVLKFVHSLSIDRENRLLVAGLLGMAYIDLEDFSYKVFIQENTAASSTIKGKTIRSITPGPEHYILAGSLDNGINILDTKTNDFLYISYDSESEKSLSNNSIKHIFVDEHGVLFVSTAGGGVNISLPQQQEYKFISGKKISFGGQQVGNGITAIGKSENNMIFGGNQGFLQWNITSGEVSKYTLSDTRKNNYSSNFIFNGAEPGIVYLSTNYDFYRLNTFKKEPIALLPSKKQAKSKLENINAIINWSKDTLVVLSEYRGIEILNLKTQALTHLNLNPLNLSFWYSIARYDQEHILASYRNGIVKVNLVTQAAEHLLSKTIPQSPVKSWVSNHIYRDHKNRWWFAGDSSLGLLHLPNKGYTMFPVKHNELLVPFLGIQEDEQGNFWLHSTYDIYHFNTQTHAYTLLHSNLVTNNHAANNQSYLDPETGIYYVTSAEGIWSVDTRLFYNDQKLKKIAIADFYITKGATDNNPALDANKKLYLSYKQNSFSIHFSNFDYEQNKNYEMEYKMDGVNSNWTPIPPSQILDFNNLEPGNYKLIIKYKNFSETHDTSLTLDIHISKPWWQTWWFLLASILMLAGSILFYIRQHTKRLKERNIALEYKVNERTKEFQVQKKQAEDLLLNILPADIVSELKTKGSTEARLHENVTVLFTDFVNFTGISAQLSPADLVQEIDRSFKAFDKIMDKYGIEKIKTIGDAYMAVAGLNKNPLEAALDSIQAALEIIDFVQNNDCLFEIRIGLNTGSVIAGVVGHKKFAYDIWGSPVNIASRMESNGIPMQINISQSTYQLVKNHFDCTYRGKVEVKNMGKMEMYLVSTTFPTKRF